MCPHGIPETSVFYGRVRFYSGVFFWFPYVVFSVLARPWLRPYSNAPRIPPGQAQWKDVFSKKFRKNSWSHSLVIVRKRSQSHTKDQCGNQVKIMQHSGTNPAFLFILVPFWVLGLHFRFILASFWVPGLHFRFILGPFGVHFESSLRLWRLLGESYRFSPPLGSSQLPFGVPFGSVLAST